MPDPRITAGAALAGVAVGLVTYSLLRPARRLAPRVDPYVQVSRARLGQPADPDLLLGDTAALTGGVLRRVFGPPAAAALAHVRVLLVGAEDDALAVRLHHAGVRSVDSRQWRLRQLGQTVGSAAAFAGAGMATGRSPAVVLTLAVLAGSGAASLSRGRLTSAIDRRRARMRTELYTVAQLLAMLVRAGEAPLASIRRVAQAGTGPVADELTGVCAQVASGTRPSLALERAATTTAEPAAARLYRLLATATTYGGDLSAALRAVAADLRTARREDAERDATRRRGLMIAATLLLMAPVMLLFLSAPIPQIVFGTRR